MAAEIIRFAPYLLSVLAAPANADDAVIETATAVQNGASWTVSVTLSHGDTGWDDYADGWRVVAVDGTVLGVRELLHPHVNEQPFTRSLSSVVVPAESGAIFVEARTNVFGWGAQRFPLDME